MIQPETEPSDASADRTAQSVHAKALQLNLDAEIYGTFAEIGAGQEVSRWFFRVGGAAGTVAKTTSAYDMQVSDAIYGPSDRYVSRQRLTAMLEYEYGMLEQTLQAQRGKQSRFFVFADTVSARNFKGTNESHGWVGMRFQVEPGSQASDILLHVNLRDPTNLLQQQAIGILGVNLIHACHYRCGSIEECFAALFESLSLARLELDHAELSGPAFANWPARNPDPWMLSRGLCRLVAADATARFLPPAELLHKQPIVMVREMFDVGDVQRGETILRQATRLMREQTRIERDPLPVFEVTSAQEGTDSEQLERRHRELAVRGIPALFSAYPEGYLLTEHLRRYTREPIGFVLESTGLLRVLWAAAQAHDGDALERLGRFLAQDVRGYVFASPAGDFDQQLDRLGIGPEFCSRAGSRMVSAVDLGLRGPVRHVVQFLLETGALVPGEPASSSA